MGVNESLTRQLEDLVPGPTVRLRWGDDALDPQTSGAQLVHAQACGHAVVAGSDPVAGGCGHDQAGPAQTAGCSPDDLSASESHGATGGPEGHTGSGQVSNDPPFSFSALAGTDQTSAGGSNTSLQSGSLQSENESFQTEGSVIHQHCSPACCCTTERNHTDTGVRSKYRSGRKIKKKKEEKRIIADANFGTSTRPTPWRCGLPTSLLPPNGPSAHLPKSQTHSNTQRQAGLKI